MTTPPTITALPLSHFVFTWAVGLTFVAGIWGIVTGLGLHTLRPSETKSPGTVWAMIAFGLGLTVAASLWQAHQDQQSDLQHQQDHQDFTEMSNRLTAVNGSLSDLSARYNTASGGLAQIAAAANVSNQKSVTEIVNAIVAKLPKPAPPAEIRIAAAQPRSLATGTVPEVLLVLTNPGPTKSIALRYEAYPVHDVNGCFDNYQYRRECEENLWQSFLSESPTQNEPVEIPSGQGSMLMRASGPRGQIVIQSTDNPTNTRIYFLGRAYTLKGKRLFNTCFYVSPNPPPNTPIQATYCISHNE